MSGRVSQPRSPVAAAPPSAPLPASPPGRPLSSIPDSISPALQPQESSWWIVRVVSRAWKWVCNWLRKLFRKDNPSADPKTEVVPLPRPEVATYSGNDCKKVAENTMVLIEQGYYLNSRGERFPLRKADVLSQGSRYIEFKQIDTVQPRFHSTQIQVRKMDCLDEAEEEVRKGGHVLVLNLSSSENPGGGFLDGIGSQEEDLCYRSDLAGFMVHQNRLFLASIGNPDPNHETLFPLYNRQYHEIPGCVLTPEVTVFRSSAQRSYAPLERPFQVGILSSAAPRVELRDLPNSALQAPTLINLGTPQVDYSDPQVKQQIKNRIVNQLDAAYQNNYDTLILSAFGCGAFHNPPRIIAQLYREVIETYFPKPSKE